MFIPKIIRTGQIYWVCQTQKNCKQNWQSHNMAPTWIPITDFPLLTASSYTHESTTKVHNTQLLLDDKIFLPTHTLAGFMYSGWMDLRATCGNGKHITRHVRTSVSTLLQQHNYKHYNFKFRVNKSPTKRLHWKWLQWGSTHKWKKTVTLPELLHTFCTLRINISVEGYLKITLK
jgi:hypothetical protein